MRPRPTLPSLSSRTLAIAAALLAAALSAGCGPALPEAEGPEIPSREEVFESYRRSGPASRAAVEAFFAYRDHVCSGERMHAWAAELPSERGCFGPGPMAELEALEKLRLASRGAPDEPVIVERMIADWRAVRGLVAATCGEPRRLPVEPTVGDIEDATEALRGLQRTADLAEEKPEELCEELKREFPAHVRRVGCPGDPESVGAKSGGLESVGAESEGANSGSPDWPLPPAPAAGPNAGQSL